VADASGPREPQSTNKQQRIGGCCARDLLDLECGTLFFFLWSLSIDLTNEDA